MFELAHRYSFSETGTSAEDSIGNAHGSVQGTTPSSGEVNLSTGGYVELPGGLLSGLSSLTVEVWLTWHESGASDFQRVFDLGSRAPNMDEGGRLDGVTYLALVANIDEVLYGVVFSNDGYDSETQIRANQLLPMGRSVHVAVVVDNDTTIYVYVDGTQQLQGNFSINLSEIEDVNNWIGRSQYEADPAFNGQIDEFRIYNRALTSQEISSTWNAGPDQLPTD